jgi:hypothetical protein
MMLNSNERSADAARMSVPPPSPVPAPEPQPWYDVRLLAIGAVALVLVAVVAFAALRPAHHEQQVCVVNGLGNELCDGAARAYCDLHAGFLSGEPGSFETCARVYAVTR